jgi:hypothetical protein
LGEELSICSKPGLGIIICPDSLIVRKDPTTIIVKMSMIIDAI